MEYRDFWVEFRQIQEATRKKNLLKRPDYDEAIKKLRLLATDMEEAAIPEHAAECQREISRLYELQQNFPLQIHHMLISAQLYHRARIFRHSLNLPVIQESEMLMEECYLKVIGSYARSGSIKLAAIIAAEAAEHFATFEAHDKAYDYYLKAARFAQGDVYLTSKVLREICALAERIAFHQHKQQRLDEMLTEIQSVWTNLLKDVSVCGPIRELLLQIECRIVLLHLRYALTTDDWQRAFLVSYLDFSTSSSSTTTPRRKSGAKQSVASPDEFAALAQFVSRIRANDSTAAGRLIAFRLGRVLDTEIRELAKEIVAYVEDNNNDDDRPSVVECTFEAILHSDDCNELEKRQKLFELYDNLERKNQLKLEDL